MRRFGTSVIKKSIDLIMKLSFESNEVQINNKIWCYTAINEIKFSPTLFLSDDCKTCGRCCVGFSLVFLPSEKVPELIKDDLHYVEIKINKRKVKIGFYKQKKLRNDNGCDFLIGNIGVIGSCKCLIHENKPLHCAFPHLRLQNNFGTTKTTMMRTQFGRNWLVGCPAHFSENNSTSISILDLKKLESIGRISHELNIKSFANQLIQLLTRAKNNTQKNLKI